MMSVASKVMWIGRAAIFLVAMGANAKPFLLGKKNVATALSTLVKRGAGPALRLKVGSGPPLAVNSSQTVTNLSADRIDGQDVIQIGVNGLQRIEEESPTNNSSPSR